MYYYVAYNLVNSYRFRGGKYRFAIICDRENEYTKAFDDVIVIDDAKKNYTDKFEILIKSPYKENIFIESDCLCFENIDCFWELFQGATDFSTFGWNEIDHNPFVDIDAVSEDFEIDKIPMFCPGYMYIKNGPICRKCLTDAKRVMEVMISKKEHYHVSFLNGNLRDDPIFSIIMVMNDCSCVCQPNVAKCINYADFKRRNGHHPKMNMYLGKLQDDDPTKNARLCHFSSKHTQLGQYKCMVNSMNHYINGKVLLGRIIESKPVCFMYKEYNDIKYKVKRRLKK